MGACCGAADSSSRTLCTEATSPDAEPPKPTKYVSGETTRRMFAAGSIGPRLHGWLLGDLLCDHGGVRVYYITHLSSDALWVLKVGGSDIFSEAGVRWSLLQHASPRAAVALPAIPAAPVP